MRVRLAAAGLVALLCALTSGCQKSPKAVQAAVAPPPPTAPAIQVPPASVLKAQADSLAEMPPQPAPVEEKPVEEAPKPARPVRRPVVAPPQQPKPAQTASSGAPVEDVIGQLSTGGDYSAQARKQSADSIADLQRRVNALSRRVVQTHKLAVDQVRDFLRKSEDALRSGDVDGANNLATKAKVLLDDIQK